MVRNTKGLGSGLQSAARRLIGVEPTQRSGRHQGSSQTHGDEQRNAQSRQSQRSRQGQQSGRGRDIQGKRGSAWGVAPAERKLLMLGMGSTAMIRDVTDRLYIDSAASAVAAVHFMSQHQEQSFAQSKLTELLIKSYPNNAAVQNDRESMGQPSSDGQLTSKLAHYKMEYLRYVHGTKSFTRGNLLELAGKVIDIADAFAQRPDESHKRQCQARFIAADLYQSARGNDDRAILEFNKALILASVGYENLELLRLVQETSGINSIVDQTLSDPATIDQARERISNSS